MKWVGSRASSSRGSCSSTGLMSSTCCRLPRRWGRWRASARWGPPSFFQAFAHPRHQPAHAQELVHELRERLRAVLVALREVAHDALLEVDLELVSFVHAFRRLWRLKDWVPHVDRVAKEDARVRVGDDERDAGSADGHRDDLVGVDVGAELPRPTPDDFGQCHAIPAGIFASTSLGCVITPVTALAAATAG